MPHKVALIPVQSARLDTDFVYQTTLRSIGAYATQRRHQKWNESIEYAILTPDGQRPNFSPFQQVDQLRLAIKDLKEQERNSFFINFHCTFQIVFFNELSKKIFKISLN